MSTPPSDTGQLVRTKEKPRWRQVLPAYVHAYKDSMCFVWLLLGPPKYEYLVSGSDWYWPCISRPKCERRLARALEDWYRVAGASSEPMETSTEWQEPRLRDQRLWQSGKILGWAARSWCRVTGALTEPPETGTEWQDIAWATRFWRRVTGASTEPPETCAELQGPRLNSQRLAQRLSRFCPSDWVWQKPPLSHQILTLSCRSLIWATRGWHWAAGV